MAVTDLDGKVMIREHFEEEYSKNWGYKII